MAALAESIRHRLSLAGLLFVLSLLGDALAEQPSGAVALARFERGREVGVGESAGLLGAVTHPLQFAAIEGIALPQRQETSPHRIETAVEAHQLFIDIPAS